MVSMAESFGLAPNPEHPDPTGGRLFPIPDLTPEALGLIPFGSETLIIDFDEDRVECGDWSQRDRDALLAVIDTMSPGQRADYFLVYLPPLLSPSHAVMNVVSEVDLGGGIDRNTDNIYRAIQSGRLSPDDLVAILMSVAHEAQKEVTPS